MSYSLNEIEALSKKAARGAGLSWGLAEEAAMAVRWLTAYGFDGVLHLADLLEKHDGKPIQELAPTSLSETIWRASSDELNPIVAGAALSDCAFRLRKAPMCMQNVCHPLLILPFLQGASEIAERPLVLRWSTVSIAVQKGGIHVQGADKDLSTHKAAQIEISIADNNHEWQTPGLRAAATTQDMRRLNKLAQRTYAPATEESRKLGAGSGDSDND